jgi:polyisoprenoid-binding protein YceI
VIRIALVVALSLLGLEIFAQSYVSSDGNIRFISKAPFNEFDGKSSNLNGLIDLDKNVLDFYVDLNTLKTGIGLRDSHMRDKYLETEEYPYAEFTGKIEDIEKIDEKSLKVGIKVTANGKFKIHGISQNREIFGILKLTDQGKISLETNFTVALKDHQIEKPSVLGYELADVQVVEIKADFNEQKK